MAQSVSSLQSALRTGVLEVKFTRRRQKQGIPATRRMWCTLCPLLLDSIRGQAIFKFQEPKRSPKYNPSANNLVIAYDLFKLDYRAVPADSANVISRIPVTNDEQLEEFWKYFNENIYNMSAQEKERFMNS